ncbi:MAG: DUF5107 domain-containing protein [Anaerolineae bacterium]|nr:DUF5107 domain-containing protein [Anaerolineae bacterium]
MRSKPSTLALVLVLLLSSPACSQVTLSPSPPIIPLPAETAGPSSTPTTALTPTSEGTPTPTPEPATAAPNAFAVSPDATPPTTEPSEATTSKTPFPSPSPSAKPSLTPEPAAVWETTVTLNSYGWEQALRPSAPDSLYAPYPGLDFDAVTAPTPHTYQAVILENAYTRVTVAPELGGRILQLEDLTTGQLLTYANPVIKPTHWGYRGWWLATGGIEWAFPVEEHGLNEYRSWSYELLAGDSWRGVRVWDTDDRTGLTVSITLRLEQDRSTLFIIPRISNPTASPQPLQFWINAMLTLSGHNSPSSSLRFWVPTDTMIVHSTNDSTLPQPRSLIDWPTHAGRDFSAYQEWHAYLGLFASQARGAVGAYDSASNQGIVRVYPQNGPQGVKIFCLGDIPSNVYTDDNSRYFEFWGGYNRTFFPEDTATLPAGETIAWEEQWYPIHGIDILNWANRDLAASLKRTGEGLIIGVYTPAPTALTLHLLQNGERKAEWSIQTGPEAPVRMLAPSTGEGWTLEIWEQETLKATLFPTF